MEFSSYANAWAKAEVYQEKIMIGVGIVLLIAFIAILRSQNVLLRGSLIPLGLLLAILLGYGCFMIYSRPAHAKEIIGLYQKSPEEAIKQETAKRQQSRGYASSHLPDPDGYCCNYMLFCVLCLL